MAARLAVVATPLVSCLLVVGMAAPLPAQRAVVSVGHPNVAPATDLLDLSTGVVTRLSNDVSDKAVFLSDGMVLLRRRSGELAWRARFMASGSEITLPADFEVSFVPSAPLPLVHPREPAVFGVYTDPIFSLAYPARVDAAGLHVWTPCEPGQFLTALDLSPDGRQLVAVCFRNLGGVDSNVTVLDSTSGAVIRQFPIPGAFLHGIALGPDGREVVVASSGPGVPEVLVRRFDLTSGALLHQATIPSPTSSIPRVVANPRRRAEPVLVRCVGSLPGDTCQAHRFDFTTLALGSEVYPPGPGPGRLFFSADGRQVITSGGAFVSRVETQSGALLNYLAAPAGGFIIAAWGAEPQPPTLAAPSVAAGTVALSWSLPAESTAATAYRLDAGSQPGLADLVTTAIGPAPSFVASGVPPGRYFVRVRAVNGNGVSAPSNEIVVDVP